MSNNFHDVLFFDPDEEHAVLHHIVWDFEFLEILDRHATRLGLGSRFVVIAGITGLGILFFLTQNFLFLFLYISN